MDPEGWTLRRGAGWVLLALVAAALAACDTADSPTSDGPVAPDEPALPLEATVEPPEPRLARLTQPQFRNTIRDVFGDGVVLPVGLEPDVRQGGLEAVGVTVATLSSRGVEQYADAAAAIAAQVVGEPERLDALVPCEPSGADDAACLRATLEPLGRTLWRRPLTADELDVLIGIGTDAAAALGTFEAAVEYPLTMLLQSPFFLYRWEIGEPDAAVLEDYPEAATDRRRLTPFELAGRLSYFLWNTTPDAELLAAAESGDLATDAGIEAQVDRLLADARARQGVRAFFSDWLHLGELDGVDKDPTLFEHFSADLAASARRETLSLIEHLVFEADADYRTLFTTRKTFLDRRLAAIYDVPAEWEGETGEVFLPEGGPRAGLLGHVSFLALASHPTSSSATLRGIFIRDTLLCDPIPPPPAGLNTAIPEPSADAKTLRERLLVHMEEPSCAVCHALVDPIGFGLENFDGIGRFRLTENGAVIDPAGELDGAEFATPRELGEAVATHERLGPCFVRSLYTYATGQRPPSGERGQVDALTEAFMTGGFKVAQLLRDVATSPGFRLTGALDASEATDPAAADPAAGDEEGTP